MGSIKKRRKTKINKHKRKKRMTQDRHKRRLRYKS
ncbi:MAG: AURKAIP1/COX24 domain-containing protein [Verrucomicrobia bacterium]|nr:AURKAIP1/COX24 domain-containing protein [Verrucomicrobiota bacterium]